MTSERMRIDGQTPHNASAGEEDEAGSVQSCSEMLREALRRKYGGSWACEIVSGERAMLFVKL